MSRYIFKLVFVSLLSIVFCGNNKAFANSIGQQQDGRVITGNVSDFKGDPVPGVTIIVKGTSIGTTANAEGSYELQNVSDDAVLVFSFIGMRTIEELVTGKTIINVVLEEDAIGLEEVISIGYGSLKKKDLTGSVASVSTEDVGSLASCQHRGCHAG